jgi:uncharacterized membrane protein YccC
MGEPVDFRDLDPAMQDAVRLQMRQEDARAVAARQAEVLGRLRSTSAHIQALAARAQQREAERARAVESEPVEDRLTQLLRQAN